MLAHGVILILVWKAHAGQELVNFPGFFFFLLPQTSPLSRKDSANHCLSCELDKGGGDFNCWIDADLAICQN